MKLPLRVEIITPARKGERTGNRVTALRWAGMLRSFGATVRLVTEHHHSDADLFIALHARASHPSVRAIRTRFPERPLLVTLTGTDLYVDLHRNSNTLESLRMADRILTLQQKAVEQLPVELHSRVVVMPQSSTAPDPLPAKRLDRFEIMVVAHLREVKDPLLSARAARLLPDSSRIEVVHLGRALTPAMEHAARAEQAANPRYFWLGQRPRRETLERLAAARLLVQSSSCEGGANAVSEAIVCRTPVLSTRVDGALGMLGLDYPGYFEVGDAAGLAGLLLRAETDADFLGSLAARCAALRPTYAKANERRIWAQLLEDLLGGED